MIPAVRDAPRDAPPQTARARRDVRAPLVVFTVVLALFFAPALLGLGVFAYRDQGRMHGPHKRFIAEQLARGDLPEWNPYGGLGFPLVAGGVDAVQHPFNALLVALPFQAGVTAWVLLSILLAAIGALAWARALGLGDAAATGAGLALALTGFLVSSTDNICFLSALAAVPLLLAAAHLFVAEGGPKRAAGLALAAGLAAAAGDPQSFAITVGLVPLCALAFVDGPPRRTRLARAAVAIAVAALGAAPFLLPVAAWIPHSSRGDPLFWMELEWYNLLPVRLLELGVPGLFGSEPAVGPSTLYHSYAGNPYTPLPWVLSEYLGASVLALAALGAARSRRAALALAAAGVFAWAAMGRNAGFGFVAERLPILKNFRYWEKVAFFTALLVVLAAAHGVDAWLRDPRRTRRIARWAGVAGSAALAAHLAGRLRPGWIVALVARSGHPAESATFASNLTRGLAHTGVALVALALVAALSARGRLAGGALVVALVGVVAADLAAANSSAYVLSPAACVAPRSAFGERLAAEPGAHRVVTPFPIDQRGDAPLLPFEWEMINGAATLNSGWNVDSRVGNFEPYTGMLPARLGRFRLRTGWMHQLPQIGIWGIDHVVVPMDDPDPARMGIRVPLDVAAADPDHRALLVRVPHRPRAYLAEEVSSVDRRGAMEFVLDPASVSSRRTVVEAPVSPNVDAPVGAARIVSDEPERVAVSVETDRVGLLVLNDMVAPGWTATIDGAPAAILPANYLARGVWAPAGRHAVTFRYETPLLREGWAVAALLGVALAAWGARRRGRLT